MKRVSVVLLAILFLAPAVRALAASKVKGISSAEVCGECHKEIYRMWKTSIHSQAMEDNVFQNAYHETESSQGASVSRVCLRCHAPLTDINHDFKLGQKVTWEGINCDVCHSIVSVEVAGGSARQTLDI
ncbi:MAG TPA: multiheme c-type cytochrome, partial [Spirochaetia bacterium]|nr:multiheme c-type cytochrome [Spirochaetia bacterium]